MYSIVLRFTKHFVVEERLLAVKELPSKVGVDIAHMLIDTLRKHGIDTSKIVGQCYDNAANMSGTYKGVQACISEVLKRDIIHIPCGAHTSNLAVKHACDYQDVVDKETANQATNLKNKLISFEFSLLLSFMVKLMRTTNGLTAHLQMKELDILTTFDIMCNTQKLLQMMRNDDVTLINIINECEKDVGLFDVNIDAEFTRLHRPRQRSRKIDMNPQSAVSLSR
ncbi:unnamed protein product, partial [Didymodactylos carnosus]